MIKLLTLPLIKTLEKSLQRYLKLNPFLVPQLKELAGQCIGIRIIGLDLTLYFVFTEETVFLQRHLQSTPDLLISAPPFTLLKLLQSEHPQEVIFNYKISIDGNIDLATKMTNLFDPKQIDWLNYLSMLTGDMIAEKTADLAQKGWHYSKKSLDEMGGNISEYIQEELTVTPSKPALELFYNDVDQLRTETDLLTARVNALLSNHKNIKEPRKKEEKP